MAWAFRNSTFKCRVYDHPVLGAHTSSVIWGIDVPGCCSAVDVHHYLSACLQVL